MSDYRSLSHTKWDCKYHVVFIPKYRRKRIFGAIRRRMGAVFRSLAEQRESRIEEGHLMPDHVHMMISIPPKYFHEKETSCQGQRGGRRRPSPGSAILPFALLVSPLFGEFGAFWGPSSRTLPSR